MSYDAVVVGAGFAGAIMAERLASQGGLDVLLVERREHVAGNAYDEINEHGVLVPRFGGHMFHTNAPRVEPARILLRGKLEIHGGTIGPRLKELQHVLGQATVGLWRTVRGGPG